MKKRIAIVEMETHSFLLEQWYVILKELNSVSFHFFVHPKVDKSLSIIPNLNKTVCNDVEKIIFKDFDWIVINTFHRNFEKFNKLFQEKKVICLVHNLNFSLNRGLPKWYNLFRSKRTFFYFLKLYLKEKIIPRRDLIYKSNRLCVLSNELKKNVKISNSLWNCEMHTIRFNFVVFNTKIKTEDEIRVVIPGNISRMRKDIDLVFNVLKRSKPKCKLKFIFLGKPENLKMKQELTNLIAFLDFNISIDFFDSFIEQKVFEFEMQNAHLLFCPIIENTSFYAVNEFYGKTKISGNEGDCITYGKIGLFPSFYPDFNWYTISYFNEESLIDFFDNLNFDFIHGEYLNLNPYIVENSLDNVKEEMERFFLSY